MAAHSQMPFKWQHLVRQHAGSHTLTSAFQMTAAHQESISPQEHMARNISDGCHPLPAIDSSTSQAQPEAL